MGAYPMTGFPDVFTLLGTGLWFALLYWWVWLPIVLGLLAYTAWFEAQRKTFLANVKWTIVELTPPPEVLFSSPKAADNLFAGLHAAYGGGTSWKSQFFQGKVPDWFSFETVSNGGETHFYIRCPEGQLHVIESLIFAQYPEAEIRPVDDYITLTPETFDPEVYDCSITELIFTKDQAYPIKTYEEFEEAGGKDEYARLDPIAPLMEIMSALGPGEHLWLEYLIRPTGGDWVKESGKVTDKLKGKKEEKRAIPGAGLFKAIDSLIIAGEPKEEKREEKQEFNLQKLTASERNVLELVEFKLAKLAFKTGIRLCYVARKESFNMSRVSSVTAMFKQFYYNNMNSFKPNPKASSRSKGVFPWLFPDDKGFGAASATLKLKKRLYKKYRAREFTKDYTILTTAELATLWHLPGLNVKAPLMPRVQAKKGQPPPYLPTRP